MNKCGHLNKLPWRLVTYKCCHGVTRSQSSSFLSSESCGCVYNSKDFKTKRIGVKSHLPKLGEVTYSLSFLLGKSGVFVSALWSAHLSQLPRRPGKPWPPSPLRVHLPPLSSFLFRIIHTGPDVLQTDKMQSEWRERWPKKRNWWSWFFLGDLKRLTNFPLPVCPEAQGWWFFREFLSMCLCWFPIGVEQIATNSMT